MDHIETPRLRLSQITEQNLNDFHAIWSTPEATKWSSRGCLKTVEESREWMKGLLISNNPEGLNYGVFVRANDTSPPSADAQMIGIVGVFRPEPIAELGYTFHPSFWGKGYATESVDAFVKRFWELRSTVRTMTAKTDAENHGSMRVLVKCGFREVRREEADIVLPAFGEGKRSAVVFEVSRPEA
ncbi:hypothetical protein V492_05425 [Pseudogymnoascus sp. VKM F-4246]|nr:hypothetical protein V492_05425 [Pseudogymnoascus sp. VKM F-4246]